MKAEKKTKTVKRQITRAMERALRMAYVSPLRRMFYAPDGDKWFGRGGVEGPSFAHRTICCLVDKGYLRYRGFGGPYVIKISCEITGSGRAWLQEADRKKAKCVSQD